VNEMIERKTWDEFRKCGFLWLANQILHVFGWAIVVDIDNNNIKEVYPARVKFRGFSEPVQTDGYKNISLYLKDNIDEIFKEATQDETD